MSGEYAFCEPVWATASSLEHIRVVTDGLLFIGGGVPNLTLCGTDLRGGWDVPTGVTEQRVIRGLCAEANPTCRKCADLWAEAEQIEDWEADQ